MPPKKSATKRQHNQDAVEPEPSQTTKKKRPQREKAALTQAPSKTATVDRVTRASNKTAHPGQIIKDNTQKRRTSEQVREEEHAKAVKLIAQKVVATSQFQETVRKAAAVEDQVRRKDLLERQLAERPDLAEEFASFVRTRTSLTGSDQHLTMAVDISSGSESDDVEDIYNFENDIPEASIADDVSEPSIGDGMADDDMYGDDEDFVLDASILDGDDVSPSEIEDKPVRKPKAKEIEDHKGTLRTLAVNAKHREPDDVSPSDVEDEPVQKPKAKKNKNPKGTLRTAVNAKHSELNVASGTKRKASVSHSSGGVGKEAAGKRVKSEGGLRGDWRQTALQANLPASTTTGHLSARSNDNTHTDNTDSADEPSEVEGEFNQDEDKTALKAARAHKMTAQAPQAGQSSRHRTTAQMGIKLEPQGSPAILQNTSASKPRISDLPFPRGESAKYMQGLKVFKATIINFSGTCVDMFAAASDPAFEGVVRDAWEVIFPDLAQHSTSKIVLAVSQGALSDHRSAMGKMALALLTKLIPTNKPVADVVTFIKQYRTPRFIARDPDAESNRGTYLAPLLLQVFAFHLGVIMNGQGGFGRPIGALALTCAALERAINGWKNGTNEIFDAAKQGNRKLISSLAFSSENWGSNAIGWTSGISALTEKRWECIINEASRHVPNKQVMKTLTDDPRAVEQDVRQAVVVSDDEFLE